MAGLRYEQRLAEALPEARHGLWFAFMDEEGPGFCQPDLMLGRDGTCFVLEAKYSWTIEGHRQLEGLYLPVVQMAIQRPVCGLVVCRRLVEGMSKVRVAREFREGLELAKTGERAVWHWLGQDTALVRAA